MSINASIYGTVGKDAELKPAGQSNVVKWSVAVNRKQGGQETTTWVNCSWFGKRAEKVSDYIRKGDKIVVYGDLYGREYNGKVSIDCDVSNIDLCSGGRREPSSGGDGGGYQAPPVPASSGLDSNFPF